MKKIHLIFFILLLAIGAHAEERKPLPDQASEQAEFVLETVWEKQFDTPVADVVFEEEEVTVKEAKERGWKGLEGKKDVEKISIPSPKILRVPKNVWFKGVRDKAVKFLDKYGKIIKQVDLDPKKNEKFIRTSSNGKYVLISRVPGEYDRQGGGLLYEENGELVWEKNEYPTPKVVSADGHVVSIAVGQEGDAPKKVIFYDPTGRELRVIENPYKDWIGGYSLEKFSEDGEYVVLGFSGILLNKTSFFLTTKTGEILWNKEFDYSMREFVFKGDVGILGVFSKYFQTKERWGWNYHVYHIDLDGRLKWVLPLEIPGGDIKVRISPDGKKAYIVSSEGFLFCVDIDAGRFVWKHKEPWSPAPGEKFPDNVPLFYDVELIDNRLYIGGRVNDPSQKEREWHATSLFVFDARNGQRIGKKEYPDRQLFLRSYKNRIFLLGLDDRRVTFLKGKDQAK